jgi:hypothetical protein
MQVRLSEITVAARARLAPLTAEVAGYIVWLVVAEVRAQAGGVSAERIGVTATGDVTLTAGDPESTLESERELRRLLGDLLGLCQSRTPALKKACERIPSGDLEGLQRELGAALIPINHAASRRALARLYRETDRARAELVAPVVVVEDDDEPRAAATVTLPSPAPTSPRLDAGWETPVSAVLHRCDIEPSARGELALVIEPEPAEPEAPVEVPPAWLLEALSDERQEAPGAAADVSLVADVDALAASQAAPRAGEQAASEAPATVGATLRSAVDAELLEIDVQFARETERPAPGWPSEWHADSPALPGAEPVAARAAVIVEWDERHPVAREPEAAAEPEDSDRRTQPGLAAVAWLSDIDVAEGAATTREPQTLRVSVPVQSGIEARHRSDLGQLLSRFLSDSGSDERITKDLRRSMGLELEAERLSEEDGARAVGS